MKDIEIPFLPEFKERMLSGQKTATSRTKKYGDTGDCFLAFGATFQLTNVSKVYLHDVASKFYKEEGFDSPAEFRRCWRRIHPRRNNGGITVWLHQFRGIEESSVRASLR